LWAVDQGSASGLGFVPRMLTRSFSSKPPSFAPAALVVMPGSRAKVSATFLFIRQTCRCLPRSRTSVSPDRVALRLERQFDGFADAGDERFSSSAGVIGRGGRAPRMGGTSIAIPSAELDRQCDPIHIDNPLSDSYRYPLSDSYPCPPVLSAILLRDFAASAEWLSLYASTPIKTQYNTNYKNLLLPCNKDSKKY